MMASPIPIPLTPEPKYCHDVTEIKDVQPKLSSSPIPSFDELDKEHLTEESGPKVLENLQTATSIAIPGDNFEELATVESLSVTRRFKVKGAMFLRGKRNRFLVRTPDGNSIFTIEEENTWWVGYFCYGLRPLELIVRNSSGEELVRIRRPLAFTTRVFPCQLQRLQVFTPPNRLIGSVIQQWTAVRPLYSVRDADGREVFKVLGPNMTISCFKDVQFYVLRPNGTLVACTNKRWEGLMHALFMAPFTDTFSIIFLEKSLTGSERALLLAAALLLDYMYYDV